MAVLEKIRVRFGVFITVIIGLALLSFIIDPSTLQTAVSVFSSKYNVGVMNRKAITYEAFQRQLDHYTNIQQLVSGSSSLDEQASDMVLQLAWQHFINEYVMYPAFRKAGVSLGQEEMFDMSQGREISPILQQEALFRDENGNFSRSRLVQFIQSMQSDPSGAAQLYWRFLESNMSQNQLYTKYFSLIDKSTVLNTIELRRDMEENNITSDVRFIMQPMGFASDTSISITSSEIKAYYEKHKPMYEQQAGRDIEYVQFSIVPSAMDISRAEAEMQKVYEEFKTTASFQQFLARNSDQPFDPSYYKAGELASISPVLDSFAFAARPRDVLPVTHEGDSFFSARVVSTKMLPDSAFVQHILLPADGIAQADSLVSVLRDGGNFDALAAQYSLIPPTGAQAAGELGWITSPMFAGVLDTCLTAPLNRPFSYTSQFGVHVFRVTQKTRPHRKVQLAILWRTAVAGKETFQQYYSQANELVTRSENKGTLFDQVAREKDWPVFPAYNIVEGAKTVANINNARELSRWTYEAKKGQVSPVITIDNKYFVVATLVGIREKGYASLADKQMEIRMELQREKQIAKMAEAVKTQMQGVFDIEELAEQMGVTVSRQTGIAFGAFGMQQLEPKFIGAVSGAPEHQLMGPVEGGIGVYVFVVDGRQTGAYYTEEDAGMRLRQITGQQGQMAAYSLTIAAKVEDRRGKFF
ncbi:MAG: SurA N-terminal domain-containing protein [Bacteroidales bacterium]|nr:SurA N-terminal domain-containing protein [Bacteroidales bacterium]